MNKYEDIFNNLASYDYSKIIKINELIKDKSFLKEIITIPNPFVFDHFTKIVQYKMDTAELYEKRNEYVKKILLSDNIELPDRWVTEYIIGYFFQENYYNFLTNLFQMTNYISDNKKELINKNNLKIYNEFVDVNKISLKEKQELFKKYYLREDLMEMFYDDITLVREDSHKELVNNTLKLNKASDVYYKDISQRLDVDVYCLDGEEFHGFVRCLSINRGDSSNHYDYVYSKDNQLGYSFSYISDKNIGTIDYDNNNVVLFYDDIDYKNIMYVHHADLHIKKMAMQYDYVSEKENEILLPQSLIAKTKNYNEIYIKGENGIKPKALICYNTISGNDIAFAQRYDIAILLINREKYKRYETFDENYDTARYQL